MITSPQNPRIKHVIALQQKSSLRREEGLFVVEGRREVERCQAAGYQIVELYMAEQQPHTPQGNSPSIFDNCTLEIDPQGHPAPQGNSSLIFDNCTLETVSPAVYARLAYRGTTEGVIAVVRQRRRTLDDLDAAWDTADKAPLIAVVESVEKPGNLGAILRTADAAAVDAVIVCEPLSDLYNPNLIRASLGAAFTVPVVACTTAEAIDFLRTHHIQILTAQLQDSSSYYAVDMRQPTAIVMGTEATGLTTLWRQAADQHILIPMLGTVDSLNVSVSTAILLYEAVRQRQH